ncbi:integrase core domain-containing protein [Erysipelothrix rhusiopathiae]|nr:integrase core domain-containing protein [Erysipelothrix rhusiopathiae]
MSEPGTSVDNAVVESYHRSFKRELIYPNKHQTKAEMKVHIIDYLIDYNVNKRIHTNLNITPRELEAPRKK